MTLAIIAIVIAGLSLAASIGAVIVATLAHRHTVERDKRLETRSVNVTCREGITSIPQAYLAQAGVMPPQHSRDVIAVRAVNGAHRPVEIRGVTFRTSDGGTLVAIPMPGHSDALPATLTDGASVTLLFHKGTLEAKAAEHGHTIATVVVTDPEAIFTEHRIHNDPGSARTTATSAPAPHLGQMTDATRPNVATQTRQSLG